MLILRNSPWAPDAIDIDSRIMRSSGTSGSRYGTHGSYDEDLEETLTRDGVFSNGSEYFEPFDAIDSGCFFPEDTLDDEVC